MASSHTKGKSEKSRFDRYKLASAQSVHRLIGASVGELGSGKTRFWLSAPQPVIFFSLDLGLEGVVDPYLEQHPSKEIRVWEKEWMPTEDTSQDDAITLRDEFLQEYEYAVQNIDHGTVVLDKETQFWELFRYAEFGAPNDAPRNYPALNQRYRRLINMVKATEANAGFIQSMKDKWETKKKNDGGTKGVNTGQRVRQGFDELGELVHQDIFHTREEGEFWLTVGKSRGPGALEVQDQKYLGNEFWELATKIFPDTEQEDWE